MSFEVFPAIDLRAGRVVRLYQGDYQRETIFADDPVAVARQWVALGARWLHLVDLDGAAAGTPRNQEAIRAIRAAVAVPLQLGGGLRSEEAVAAALADGIDRVVLGTLAVEEPERLRALAARFGPRLALSLDARQGKLASRGWVATSERRVEELATEAGQLGIGCLIVTDITQDGTLAGPNLALIAAVRAASGLAVIAAGGIRSLDDLAAVKRAGAAGAILGRALYEGTLPLPVALSVQC
ncbi:MAG: 1-(5-phosphoribosyl)-5-[(5-phosphoribosylamino)methylideneamino]imidazole-4-carboxamide isomerase [Chloroflexi bacterium]|nr:1-(5-phosphoribosyl)-5-[(5-phosphoribosylamino)methylideneamino]imidazole-4-carboxamide isomerase [Chloroflexota bacterium]